MKKKLQILYILSTCLSFGACMTGGLPTGFGPQGVLFSNTKQGVGSNGSVDGPLKADGCIHSFGLDRGYATFGDASPEKIARYSGITNIHTVDKTTMAILFVYTNQCTFITGDNLPIVADKAGTNSSNADPAFNEIVVLKNGEILEGVKTTVTAKELIVTDAKGNTTVYQKKEVLSVRKKTK